MPPLSSSGGGAAAGHNEETANNPPLITESRSSPIPTPTHDSASHSSADTAMIQSDGIAHGQISPSSSPNTAFSLIAPQVASVIDSNV
jgi:hypothetical protein